MLKETQARFNHNNNISGVATGLFIGSMIGAATMLFLAPQSGKRTRAQLQLKGIEMRNRTTELVEDTVADARLESRKILTNGRHKVKELVQQGQELVADQLEHVSEAVETGKKAILGPRS